MSSKLSLLQRAIDETRPVRFDLYGETFDCGTLVLDPKKTGTARNRFFAMRIIWNEGGNLSFRVVPFPIEISEIKNLQLLSPRPELFDDAKLRAVEEIANTYPLPD